MNAEVGQLDQSVARQFWAHKASEGENRWTPEGMLEFEIQLASTAAPHAERILDLGCGFGTLSRRLTPPQGQLVAVDWEPQYRAAFTETNQTFIERRVTEFTSFSAFDLVLLFGVVTFLSEDEETALYSRIGELLSNRGAALIKNQCSRAEEFSFCGYSESLGAEYSGRYPNAVQQQTRLLSRFHEVDAVEYPQEFNPWPNSFHIAFICRRPRTLGPQ
jgi:trans-aconitate methyltransferase